MCPANLAGSRDITSEYELKFSTSFTQNESQSTKVIIRAPDTMPPLPAAVEVAVYRIAMETISNCLQHAQAQNCILRLDVEDELRLDISDDGVGLKANGTTGIGLTSMKERARELGGTFELHSQPNQGTRIQVTLPLDSGVNIVKLEG